jgi:hypothetical protein
MHNLEERFEKLEKQILANRLKTSLITVRFIYIS